MDEPWWPLTFEKLYEGNNSNSQMAARAQIDGRSIRINHGPSIAHPNGEVTYRVWDLCQKGTGRVPIFVTQDPLELRCFLMSLAYPRSNE